tara:strand:+ start:95 stop:739 length:645 start_codon:yes stop_codon:yes gene_type:complete
MFDHTLGAHNQRTSKHQAIIMASTTTELSQRMAHVRAVHPDGRTRQHKEAVKYVYESTIAELAQRLSTETAKNKQLRSRAALANYDNEATPSCSICMEDMCGRVTLVCGHEMCPECFAQHSRVNNTCPFCREEFAPKPKKQSKMPLYQIDSIAEMWADSVATWTPTHSNYFKRQLLVNRSKNDAQAEEHIRWLITANGKILMEKVKNWYDNDIA